MRWKSKPRRPEGSSPGVISFGPVFGPKPLAALGGRLISSRVQTSRWEVWSSPGIVRRTVDAAQERGEVAKDDFFVGRAALLDDFALAGTLRALPSLPMRFATVSRDTVARFRARGANLRTGPDVPKGNVGKATAADVGLSRKELLQSVDDFRSTPDYVHVEDRDMADAAMMTLGRQKRCRVERPCALSAMANAFAWSATGGWKSS
jgi:hypothetical protein